MKQSYFQFKQFTVHQEACAMKVCTDACILGAVAAQRWAHLTATDKLLDVGTGTGLLSLMIAQTSNAAIDAIELNEAAAKQAAQNIMSSPFTNKINVTQGDFLSYQPGQQYDAIISNPPFYEADLTSPDAAKNAAMHDSTLTLANLLSRIDQLIKADGEILLLLPYHRQTALFQLAQSHQWFITVQIIIQHSEQHPWFRSIVGFSKKERPSQQVELCIKNNEGAYSDAFVTLLKPFYLQL